jgi:hypothetical protein
MSVILVGMENLRSTIHAGMADLAVPWSAGYGRLMVGKRLANENYWICSMIELKLYVADH